MSMDMNKRHVLSATGATFYQHVVLVRLVGGAEDFSPSLFPA
jgi:hypothetical protein